MKRVKANFDAEEARAEIKDLKKSVAYLQDELFRLQNAIFELGESDKQLIR